MTIGQHIRLEIERSGKSKQQISIMSGVKYCTISGWIYQGNDPSATSLIKIADALKISLDQLVGRSTEGRHGHWIRATKGIRFTHYICSECGNKEEIGGKNYCSQCGATMDEERSKA